MNKIYAGNPYVPLIEFSRNSLTGEIRILANEPDSAEWPQQEVLDFTRPDGTAPTKYALQITTEGFSITALD